MASIKNLEPGTYKAKIVDWGVTEVEKLGGQLKVFIKMDIEHHGQYYTGTWDCFCLTKDGQPNKKLMKTLVTVGFQGESLEEFSRQGSLNNQKEYEVTVILDGEYKRIEWINDPAMSLVPKVSDVKKLSGFNFKDAIKEARKELGVTTGLQVPNHAPGAKDELGF